MKIKYSGILMWLLIISPIMDNLNGYLLLSRRNSNISVMFKTLIFLFCLLMIFKSITEKRIIEIFGMIFLFALQLVIFEINYNGGLNDNFSSLIKLLTPIVIAMAAHSLESYDRATVVCIDKVARFYCWFFPLSLLIPFVFNIGFSTYRGGVGSKGFYFAGNEISIIMVMIFAMEIEKYKRNKTKANFLNMILGAASLLYIGTKTAYISLIVFILLALYSEKNINKKVLNIILMVPSIFGGLWYVINNVNTVTRIIETIVWKYVTSSARGVSFWLSGRELRISRAIELVYDKNLIGNILIGIGSAAAEKGLNILIEMDLLDLFIRFGLIVSIVIIGFYVKNMKLIMKTKNILYIMGSALACGASVFAGHMIFAPMVSMVLVILFLESEFRETGQKRNYDI